jgi:hypothetical protein
MRYYYFWLVDCAVVAKISRLPVKGVYVSSCIWAGFALVALVGLYLKHFLKVGNRLREQFLITISLLTVTGFYIIVNLWAIFYSHHPSIGYVEVWPEGQFTSWLNALFLYPHHIISMVCCLFAFLLVWMEPDNQRNSMSVIALVAVSLASAFGLSCYVTFAFFLIAIVWSIWRIAFERRPRFVVLLACGAAVALVLLLPYLQELTHGSSRLVRGSLFVLRVRETIPPEPLLATAVFRHIAISHPLAARSLANLILMGPGYAIELGLFGIIFLACLIPSWRGRTPLTPAQRSLVFIAAATFPFMSLLRSGVLSVNDFGIHAGLFVQFPLLLLASEFIMSWRLERGRPNSSVTKDSLTFQSPIWLRSGTKLATFLGVISTIWIALMLRFVPFWVIQNGSSRSLAHKAYISSLGYAHLNLAVPRDAVLQFNPSAPSVYWQNTDLMNIDHQTTIASDQPWCGSELGGDPSGCPEMAAAIDALYNGEKAEQARDTCRQYGIHYLVANMYDQAWKDRQGWVWTLNPVVADPEFRALDCRVHNPTANALK